MAVNVRLFGPYAQAVGSRHSIDLADCSVEALFEHLAKDSSLLQASKSSCRPAVNHKFVDWDHVVADGDEVAFIPPVSGG